LPHKFTPTGKCKECGKDEVYTYNRTCSLCMYKKMEKKRKKVFVYACSVCGSQWQTSNKAPDILAQDISHHMMMQHNDEFVKKVLNSFVKQYRDYDEPVIVE